MNIKIVDKEPIPTFKPVVVELVIESQEEFDTLYNLSGRNCSIPNIIKDIGGSYNITVEFLDKFRKSLEHIKFNK